VTRDALGQMLIDRLATPRPLAPDLLHLRGVLEARWPEGRQLIQLIVGFYDPALDPAWIPVLWPSMQIVVMTSATALGAGPVERTDLFRRLHQGRRALITSRSRPRRLHHRATPLAAFHASQWAVRPSSRAGLYVLVAAVVHAATRVLEGQMLAQVTRFGPRLDANLYDYLRAARVLCEHGPTPQALARSLRWAFLQCW